MSQPRKRLTQKQENLARALAKSPSVSAAAKAIGIHPNSALRMLEKDGVRGRADDLRDRNERTQAVQARRILGKSLSTVERALPDDDSGDPLFALQAARIMPDVLEKIPAEHAPLLSESPHDRLRRYRAAIHACIVGARNPHMLASLTEHLLACDNALKPR